MRASSAAPLFVLTCLGWMGLVACGDDSSVGTGGGDEGATTSTGAQTGVGGGSSSSGTGGEGGGGRIAGDLLFGSGDRLRAMVLDGGDEAVSFAGFMDTEIGERCSFVDLGDGTQRCAPGFAQAYYADAACTQPVLPGGGPCEPTSPYGRAYTPGDDACAGGFPTIVRSTGVASDAPEIFAFDGPSCTSAGSSEGLGLLVAEVVPPEAFVAAELVTEPLDDRLGRSILLAEDGATLVVGAVDLTREEACLPPYRMEEDEDPRCEPTNTAFAGAGYFADAACDQPAAVVFECQPPPSLTVESLEGGCFGGAQIFSELGAPLDTLHGTETGTCEVSDGVTGFAVGAPVDRSMFPAVEAVSIGTGAVRVDGVGSGAAWITTTGYLVDTARGLECYQEETTEGTRCMPSGAPQVSVDYADDACTIPVVVGAADGECYEAVRIAVEYGPTPECGRSTIVAAYEVGEVVPGPFFSEVDGECLSLDIGELVARLVGDEIPLDTFPTLTLRQE